jgi:hypothetical protein
VAGRSTTSNHCSNSCKESKQVKRRKKKKTVIEIITIPTAGAVVLATAITIAEDAVDVEETAVVAAGEPTILSIYRILNVLIVAKKVTTPLIVPTQEKITMKTQTWFPTRIPKTWFNPL